MVHKLLSFTRERLSRARAIRLLLAAAGLHLLIAIVIYTAGQLSLLPEPFARGSGQFAFDSILYQQRAQTLTEVLNNNGITAWLHAPSEPHVRLYSLSYFIFKPLFGYSALAIEPLNLFYYLVALLLIYQIGKEAFGRVSGLTAAIVVALWPSFLLHTTQILKDPLYIVCMLALAFACVLWLRTTCSWKSALLTLLLGCIVVAILAWMKSNMWETVLVFIGVGALLLLWRQISARRVLVWNLLSAALLIVFMFVMPIRPTIVHLRDQQAVMIAQQNTMESSFLWKTLGARIDQRRRAFSRYRQGQGSIIDDDIYFNSMADIALYLPRATLVGLFAPFPQMWFAADANMGRAARLLSGVETFLFYFAAVAAAFCVYVERRNLAAWFLLLAALINMIALGLIVSNVGTLFRLRYVFWMLIIILGARGAGLLARKFLERLAIKDLSLNLQTDTGIREDGSP